MPTGKSITEKPLDGLRIFLYGPPKSKKTTWCLKAAEAGFRVLVFDADRGLNVLAQINKNALERIYSMPIYDGPTDANAALSMASILRRQEFWFDEQTRFYIHSARTGLRHCNLRDFGPETLLVFDYTAIVESVVRQYAGENNIDLTDARKPEWEGYRWCGTILTWMLTQLRTLNRCHYVCIGHMTQYEKHKPPPTDPKKQGPLEWTRQQMFSSSNPHAMSIGHHFTDVLKLYKEGATFWVDSTGNKFDEGGSQSIAPGKYEWDKLQFVDLLKSVGHIAPNPAAQPFDFPLIEAGTITPVPAPAVSADNRGGIIRPKQRISSFISTASK